MRFKSSIVPNMILMATLLLIGCERSKTEIQSPRPVPPGSSSNSTVPDLALVGDWSGKTSHQTQINLTVENINGLAYVTHVSGVFRCFDTQYFWNIDASDANGLARITGGEFFYTFTDSTLSSWSMAGEFVSFYTLSGGFLLNVIDPASGETCEDRGIFKAGR